MKLKQQLADTEARWILNNWEIWRIRLGTWRVIYGIDEELQQVAVLAIRKRPPYDYEDISDLLANLE